MGPEHKTGSADDVQKDRNGFLGSPLVELLRSSFVYSECVLAKIATRIARERMFSPDDRIGVAVSGGPDSVALLHALRELFPEGVRVVIHLNHGLRGADADGDELFVRDLAAECGCDFFVRHRNIAQAAERGRSNLEQAGRTCRYRFFRELLEQGVCDTIATGHTQSDQAETVLFRLLRGSGGAGLSAVWPVYRKRIVRPMLDVSREEVVEYLRKKAISWREDASNADPAFARNRLRHGLLPLLRRDWNPNVDAVLARTADWAREEERFWRRHTARLWRRCVREGSEGLLLDVPSARRLCPAEQRRLLRAVLKRPELHAASAGFEHIEEVRALLASTSGTGGVDLPGARAERSFDTILFRSRGPLMRDGYDLALPVPGRATLPGASQRFVRTRLVALSEMQTLYDVRGSGLLDWDRVPQPLRLRNWRPGDRYRPAGRDVPTKIRDLFQRSGVSAWKRASWPVVTSSGPGPGCIVWAREFGPAEEFAVRPGSRQVLVVDEFWDREGNHVSKSASITS